MGLGLEMWDLRYWFSYVLAMIVLESWLIGRWAKLSWPVCIGVSVLANAVTGFGCGAAGLVAPILHYPIVGSTFNPNPFVNSVALLLLFSIPSAWIESIVWRWTTKPKEIGKFVKRVFLVHLAMVPVGLAILLIPERPYVGMEAFTSSWRRMEFRSLRDEIGTYIGEQERLPVSTNVRGVATELAPYLNSTSSDFAYSLYEPDFGRFSIGERWRKPFEVNESIAGRAITVAEPEKPTNLVWYIRRPYRGAEQNFGLVVDLSTGMVEFTIDDNKLGY